MDMFPTEASARQWFEDVRWAAGRYCGHCGSTNTHAVASGEPMPYRCSDCRKYFSVCTGTPMQSSRLPLRKWVIAMYLMTTSLKGVSRPQGPRPRDVRGRGPQAPQASAATLRRERTDATREPRLSSSCSATTHLCHCDLVTSWWPSGSRGPRPAGPGARLWNQFPGRGTLTFRGAWKGLVALWQVRSLFRPTKS